MTEVKQDWTFWKETLKDRAAIKNFKVSENDPQAGFYRLRYGKDKPWQPVAIWKNAEGKMVGLISGKPVRTIEETWTWCMKSPISYPAYKHALDTGEWEDMDGIGPTAEQEARGLGSNKIRTPLEVLNENIDIAIKAAEEALTAINDKGGLESQTGADLIANHALQIKGLVKDAEEMRKAAKEPILAQGREIDATFNEMKARPSVVLKGLTMMLQAYDERLKEAQRRKNEAEMAKRAEAEKTGETRVAEPIEEAPKRTYGDGAAFGSKSLGTRKKVTAIIEDYDKCLLHFKDNEKVKDLIQKLANAAVKAGNAVPGAKKNEEDKI